MAFLLSEEQNGSLSYKFDVVVAGLRGLEPEHADDHGSSEEKVTESDRGLG